MFDRGNSEGGSPKLIQGQKLFVTHQSFGSSNRDMVVKTLPYYLHSTLKFYFNFHIWVLPK